MLYKSFYNKNVELEIVTITVAVKCKIRLMFRQGKITVRGLETIYKGCSTN